jgi:exonuclease III
VGILIKRCLNITVDNIRTDRTGNILAMTIHNSIVQPTTICSIYGPNDNNREFYADLNSIFESVNNERIICGGDFNCTWDPSPINENVDTFFMRNLPSVFRTEKIRQMADKFNLTEPFRMFHPVRKDYTYIPNAAENRNRSRIDFFSNVK